jgi:L-aminopeptidase/D-esterase-like protein
VRTNDAERPAPRTDVGEPALAFDLPGVEIGVAEYDDGPTGCTVFHFPERVAAAVDVRGGAHGTTGAYPQLDAICLAGGSTYGLEAVSGVAGELFARRGHSVAWPDIALVAGAII